MHGSGSSKEPSVRRSPSPAHETAILGEIRRHNTRWRHLASTVEQLCTASIRGSASKGRDAASSQITLEFLVVC